MKKIFIASLMAISCSSAFASTAADTVEVVSVDPTIAIAEAGMQKAYEAFSAADIHADYCKVDIKAGNPTSVHCEAFVIEMANAAVGFDAVDQNKTAGYKSLSFTKGLELVRYAASFELLSRDLTEVAPELFVKHNPYPETVVETDEGFGEGTPAEGSL